MEWWVSKPCGADPRTCPGAYGRTRTLFLSRALETDKDDPLIRFFAYLDAAASRLEGIGSSIGARIARALRMVAAFVATGDHELLRRGEAELQAAFRELVSVDGKPINGWLVCGSDRCHQANVARAEIRLAETYAVELARRDRAVREVLPLLNAASNLVFDLMSLLGARIVRSFAADQQLYYYT